MPRQGLTKPLKNSMEEKKVAPVPSTGRSLGSILVESMASGAGSGIGFSLVQNLMRPTRVEQDPKVCEQFNMNLERCMFENDMETCHKVFKNIDKTFYTRCVSNAPELSKE